MSHGPARAGRDPASPGTGPASAAPGASPSGRRVRSYVRREGRITDAQVRAIEELLPRYGTGPIAGELDFGILFGRRAPVVLEVGSGDGALIADLAAANPDRDFLAVEVYRPGVGSLLRRLEAHRLGNVRVAWMDAVELLERSVPNASLDAVLVMFPDPWPKKRHHKRRLLQPRFSRLVATRLRPGGILSVATDWADYAQQIDEVLSAEPLLQHTAGRPFDDLPVTRYEARGRGLGHEVREFTRRRVP